MNFSQLGIETHHSILSSQEFFDRYLHEGMSLATVNLFRSIIYDYYAKNERQFAWRSLISPYHVLVSEIMLQQTQTYRVAPKFDAFIEKFPNLQALASASFEEVLRYWKGLGYNRRAMNLQKTAQIIVEKYNAIVPCDPEILVTFPGIGKATAASICAFAYNKPTVFIETNIRTVFIYFFFKNETAVPDQALISLIQATVDKQNPRVWYYALMDYGVMLKKEIGNISIFSKHHSKQSKFIGSNRQIRGKILELLLQNKALTCDEISNFLVFSSENIKNALNQLEKEHFITKQGELFLLKS